jgi:hypothetical protein
MKTSNVPVNGANLAPVAPKVNTRKLRQDFLDVLDALPINKKSIQLANPSGGASVRIFRKEDHLIINHGKNQVAKLRCTQASLQSDGALRNAMEKVIERLVQTNLEVAQIFMDYQA